ncbi:MAG: aldo/keto reductase [Pseudomonadota bacterium]
MKIAYGFWRYGNGDLETAMDMVEAAREAGITHLDTADVYGYPDFGAAEKLLGEMRARAPSLLQGVEIATKASVEIGTPYNASKNYIANAIDASLMRLQLECVDLFYIHRPDMFAHPAETAAALDAIVTAGKAKRIGVSNYSVPQLNSLQAHLTAPVTALQVEFSALHVSPASDGTFDLAMERSLDVFAWSPLAGGRLFQGEDLQAIRVRKSVEAIATERGTTIDDVAISFVTSHPAAPTAIVGTKNKYRLAQAVKASTERLDRKEWYAVFQACTGEKLP